MLASLVLGCSGQVDPSASDPSSATGSTAAASSSPGPGTTGDGEGEDGAFASTSSSPSSSSDSGGDEGSTATSTSPDPSETTGGDEGSTTREGSDSDGDSGTDDGGVGSGGPSLEPWDGCTFSESFDGIPDGDPWPAPWIATGGVLLADVQGGRGRLLPMPGEYGLGRMWTPLLCTNVEGSFTFEITEGVTQGAGLYLRHNEGYLLETDPPGRGYVAFSQAIGPSQGIALYREDDGVESLVAPTAPSAVVPGVVYGVRFRITQITPAWTRLQARIWPTTELEPASWNLDELDNTASLQGLAGGVAIDAWTELEAGMPFDLFVDDIVITAARM